MIKLGGVKKLGQKNTNNNQASDPLDLSWTSEFMPAIGPETGPPPTPAFDTWPTDMQPGDEGFAEALAKPPKSSKPPSFMDKREQDVDNFEAALDAVGTTDHPIMEKLAVGFTALQLVVNPIQDVVDATLAFVLGTPPPQPAAAHFDIVLGIDIHTVVLPPGVPTPLPTPHIGLVLDPFDYLWGLFATTVHVHGRKFGGGGTGGIAFLHIPFGGPFAPWPGLFSEILLGSSTVWADAMPFSTQSRLVLTCQLAGMPTIPRGKLPRPNRGLTLPMGQIISIPWGAPVIVGGPNTISVLAFAMKGIIGALGRFAKKAAGAIVNALKKLMKMIKKAWKAVSKMMAKISAKIAQLLTSLRNKLAKFKCKFTGDPVDVATGKVVSDAVDVELPGPLPLTFERTWYSTSTWRGELGHGWHHNLEMSLHMDQGAVAARLADGRCVALGHPGAGLPSFEPSEKLLLYFNSDGYVLEDAEGLRYHFGGAGRSRAFLPPEGADLLTLKLQEVRDLNGNRIRLERDGGHLAYIHDSAGRALPVRCDTQGRILEIQAPDPNRQGRLVPLVQYSYDVEGDLVCVTDAEGAGAQYMYQNHLMTQRKDRQGTSFYFEYDGDDHDAWCTRTWGDRGVLPRTLAYDKVGRTTRVTDSRGTIEYHWTELGLVTREVDALGGETLTEYDSDQNKVSETDALGNSTRSTYDSSGQLVSLTSPSGATTTFEHDPEGNLTSVTNALGATWRYRYDSRRNLTSVEDPEGGCWRYELDHRGLPMRSIDPLEHASQLTWSERGDLSQVIDRAGGVTKLRHDALGRLTRRIDPEGGRTELSWSLSGRLIEVSDASGRRNHYRYDGEGNLLSARDPLGRVRRFEYGPLGVLTRSIEPSGMTTTYGYDSELDLEVVIDARGKRWTFDRDAEGRVVREVSFDGRADRYERDLAGNLVASIKNSGLRAEYERDAEGRLTRVSYPSGREETLAYDRLGRLTQAAGQAVSQFTYDSLGRVIAERMDGEEVRSHFDAIGNRLRRESPFGRSVELRYDPEGRLASLGDSERTLMSFQYDHLGRERRRDLPNGVVSVRDYLPTGELKSSRTVSKGLTLLARDYHYNAAGEVEGIGRGDEGLTRYEHDLDGRLVAELYPDEKVKRYDFDEAGNVPGVPDGSWDKDGFFRSTVDGWSLTYDRDGNLVSKLGDHMGWSYEFDEAGRLAKVKRGPGRISGLGVQTLVRDADGTDLEVTFTYDPLSRRREKRLRWADGREENVAFLWDNNLLLGQIVTERDSNGTVVKQPTQEVTFRPDSWEPLHQWSSNSGETRFECDNKSAVIQSVDFSDSFSASSVMPIKSPGQYLDIEVGLLYNRHRYKEAEGRKFISSDPFGLYGGPDLWAYPKDPLNWIDPLGLSALKCGGNLPSHVDGAYEYFYRAVSRQDYQAFLKTKRIPATGETFISPTKAFSESYNGVLIKFQVPAGTTNRLRSIGVRANGSKAAGLLPDLPQVQRGWGGKSALFKPEGSQINIGLGKGDALNIFNNNIKGFEVLGVK